jgi:alpha-tubulin suppressor-like RCC1 family protein
MDFLPDDTILQIALYEPIDSINKLCQTSNRFNNLICNNNYFWRQKYIYDYGIPSTNIVNWKEAYQNYGIVAAFGQNIFGQLGLGDDQNRNRPTLISNIKAQAVFCGGFHTMIMDLNNNIWFFGDNRYGQLGLGDNQNRNVPTQIPNIEAQDISCGGDHTMIMDLNNNVWSFGYNAYEQLGLGDNQNRNVPTQIPNIKAQSVSCGYYHTIIILASDSDEYLIPP